MDGLVQPVSSESLEPNEENILTLRGVAAIERMDGILLVSFDPLL